MTTQGPHISIRFTTRFVSIVRLLSFVFACASPILQAASALTADQALASLQDGNARFTSGQPSHPNQSADRRIEVAKGQNPFATVLTCSDSRLPAEVLFDRGLGDLFVVRVAGNVAKTDEIGSIEYGTDHLGTPLLVVLGHSSCGAVIAVAEGAEVHGHIPQLVDTIVASVAKTRAASPGLTGPSFIAHAVEGNVWHSIGEILEKSSAVRNRVKAGKLKVVGAVYDLEMGVVQWRGEHPEQARLLAITQDNHGEHAAHEETATEAHATPVAHGTATPASQTETEHATSLGYATIALGALALALLVAGIHYYSRTGMQRQTVNARLTLGFTCVLLVLTGLAAESYVSLHTALRDFVEYRKDARHGMLAGLIESNFLEMRIAAKDFQISKQTGNITAYEARKAKVHEFVKEGERELAQEPKRRETLEKIERHIADHVTAFAALTEIGRGDSSTQFAEAGRKLAKIGEAVDHEIEALKLEIINEQNHVGPIMAADLHHTQSTVVWVGIAAIVLGIALAIIISHSITGPLRLLAQSIGAGSEETAAASGQVSAASQSLAEGASEQAASLEETSASLEELSSTTKRNAENAQQAKAASNEARGAADTGASQMQAMQGAMQTIKSASEDITKILKTIDEIAFQTNILALNAAVEAARAGEHGAGFAVVAEEVRALAQRSAVAAKETAAKIEHSVNQSRHGVQISAEVARNFADIQTRIQQLESIVAEIASASNEQSQGIGQVTTAISQMDQVTQANAGSAEETAAAAEELSSQSMMLRDAVTQLRRLVGGSIVSVEAVAHADAPATARKPAPIKAAAHEARHR